MNMHHQGTVTKFEIADLRTNSRAADNSTYKKLAVQCSADTFVFNQTLVLHINPVRTGW